MLGQHSGLLLLADMTCIPDIRGSLKVLPDWIGMSIARSTLHLVQGPVKLKRDSGD